MFLKATLKDLKPKAFMKSELNQILNIFHLKKKIGRKIDINGIFSFSNWQASMHHVVDVSFHVGKKNITIVKRE